METDRCEDLVRMHAVATPRRTLLASTAGALLATLPLALRSQDTSARRHKRHKQGNVKGYGDDPACYGHAPCRNGMTCVRGACAPANG